MTRREIETALRNGDRLVIQDKADGSVRCVIREGSGRDVRAYRIRFDQYMYHFDSPGHLRLVEYRTIKGYDYCEYAAGPALGFATVGL